MSDPYVYPGTDTLINHFDVRDSVKLQRIESYSFLQKQEEPLPEGKFDYEHLKAIHTHFFDQVYPWAGQERSVDIAKENSFFAHAQYISKELNKLFSRLEKDNHLIGLKQEDFSEKLAHYFNEINAAHPFREGNGRTQRAFCKALAEKAGYELDWKKVSKDEYLKASIAGFKGDDAPLVKIINNLVWPLQKGKNKSQKIQADAADKQDILGKLKQKYPEINALDKLMKDRSVKNISAYRAEKIDNNIAQTASKITKNPKLSNEIKTRMPKLFKFLNMKSQEKYKGLGHDE